MALINCPNCGNRISDKARQCPACGQMFNGDAERTTFDVATPDDGKTEIVGGAPYYDGQPEPDSSSKKNMWLYIIIGVLSLAIIGLVLYLLLGNNGKSRHRHYDDEDEDDTELVEKNGTDSVAVEPKEVAKVETVKVLDVKPDPKPAPVVEAAPAPAPAPKPSWSDGYYQLYGEMRGKSGTHADISFTFSVYGGSPSEGVYYNYKADDGSIPVSLWRNGNTISGEGYDNAGAYFTFDFHPTGSSTYKGHLYFHGNKNAGMAVTLYRSY